MHFSPAVFYLSPTPTATCTGENCSVARTNRFSLKVRCFLYARIIRSLPFFYDPKAARGARPLRTTLMGKSTGTDEPTHDAAAAA